MYPTERTDRDPSIRASAAKHALPVADSVPDMMKAQLVDVVPHIARPLPPLIASLTLSDDPIRDGPAIDIPLPIWTASRAVRVDPNIEGPLIDAAESDVMAAISEMLPATFTLSWTDNEKPVTIPP